MVTTGQLARFAAVLAAAMLMAVTAGCGTAGSSGSPGPAPLSSASVPASPLPATTHWLIAASAVSKLDGVAGRATVARYLDGPQTTVITGSTIPSGLGDWHTAFALDTRSLAEIKNGIGSGLPSRISEILYDPERWSYTPPAEQSDVGGAAAQAASLARGAGRQLIVAPATDLAAGAVPGESAATAFLHSDDLGKVAASASVVDIQAQGLERNPASYAAYISKAASQIRAANRAAVIYAGLSTNPSRAPVTVAELAADVSLTSPEVTGYWLNIPSPGTACPKCGRPQPQIGLRLLRKLAQ